MRLDSVNRQLLSVQAGKLDAANRKIVSLERRLRELRAASLDFAKLTEQEDVWRQVLASIESPTEATASI